MDDSGEEIFILLFLKSDPTLNKDKEDTSLTVTFPKRQTHEMGLVRQRKGGSSKSLSLGRAWCVLAIERRNVQLQWEENVTFQEVED